MAQRLRLISMVLVVICFCQISTVACAEDLKRLDQLLPTIAKYEQGQDRTALGELDRIITESYSSPERLKELEKRLAAFITSDATLTSRYLICKKLSVFATEQSVAAMSQILTEPSTSDMARYVLERIEDSAADKALRDALAKTTGNVKVGIINTIGMRKDTEAVGVLAELVIDSDTKVAIAATAALGRIGNTQAAETLGQARGKTTATVRSKVLDAYLLCADKMAKAGEKGNALNIYDQLLEKTEPAYIRIAALKGKVKISGRRGGRAVIRVIRSGDAVLLTEAISLTREMPGKRLTKALVASLPKLSVIGKVQLLAALAAREGPNVLPAISTAAKDNDLAVRIAAITAMGRLGEPAGVMTLAQIAASTRGAEQQAARESLYSLKGANIDDTIIADITAAQSKTRIELIRALGQRRVYSGIGILLKTATDPEVKVRIETLKSLKIIAVPKDLSALVGFLVKSQNFAERAEAEKTVVAIANKISDRNQRASKILAVLGSVKDIKARASLLQALGKIGDPGALGVLRAALAEPTADIQNAAVRGLSEWPDAAPIPDLFDMAQKTGNKMQKVLTLRGLIRLLALESEKPSSEIVEMYKKIMAMTTNVDVKKRVLSGLAEVKSIEALEMAMGYLDDKALQQEAEAAVIEIATAVGGCHPEKSRDALKKILEISKNEIVKEKAKKAIEEIK